MLQIQKATAGHIHLGAKSENGPIVVTLFQYDTPMNEVSENGTITDDKLEGPMTGSKYLIWQLLKPTVRYMSIFTQNRILMERHVDMY
jgi:hypothetical protein